MGWTREYVEAMPWEKFRQHELWVDVERAPLAYGGFGEETADKIADDKWLYDRQKMEGLR